MEAVDDRLVEALCSAASELGFRLEAPYDAVRADGERVRIEGYLPDFGGPGGLAVVSFARRLKLGSLELPMSILTKDYRKYRAKLFISALNDWGWYGPEPRPNWLQAR